MNMLEAATEYAKKYGWSVFPVSVETKRPLTPHGCLDAKTDPGAIENWWKKWPDAAIGVATGSASGFIAVDLDKDEDKGLDGYHELRLWEREHGSLPNTVQSITGRGGAHLLFRYNGTDIRNGSSDKLEGVDVRGEGGYIIVPPSKHPSGNSYEWEISPDDIEMAEVNDLVFDLVRKEAPTAEQHFELPDKIKPGSRNDVLYKLACSLQGKGIPDEGIYQSVRSVNLERCEDPLSDNEIRRIVTSATRYEKGEIIDPEEIKLGKRKEVQKHDHKIRKLKTAEGLIEKDIPEPVVLVGVGAELPFLVEGTCILSAKPKLGKSWLALALCLAVANGEDFLGYKTLKSSALYLDLETSESIQKKRLLKMLDGKPVPKNFYLETETNSIDDGFVDQLEAYIKEDPQLKLIVVDVFQIIRSPSKNFKETEYAHAYRDLTPLNELAQKHHISIILVCHDRKAVDPDDPFSNILGSTGIQGAATQMIVMFKKKKDDPIHVSVKGKTIDGLPELNVKLDKAKWEVVEGNGAEQEQLRDELMYRESGIRAAVLKIINAEGRWKGRCGELIQKSVEHDVPIIETAKQVGGFLHRQIGRFLREDGIKILIIKNGTGGTVYEISKSTVDTVDENEWLTVDEAKKADKYGLCEIPFT